MNVEREAAEQQNVEESEGARTLKLLEKDVHDRVLCLMRTTHALCKNGRPFTDFKWMIELQGDNGVDVGET